MLFEQSQALTMPRTFRNVVGVSRFTHGESAMTTMTTCQQ